MSNKTVPSVKDPIAFIKNLEYKEKIEDSLELIEFLKEISEWDPKVWGKDMIGFGKYHYRYKSGREGESFVFGFSPKKNMFSFYTTLYVEGNEDLVKAIGIKKHGKACLYFKALEDINLQALKKYISKSIEKLKEREGFKIID